MATGESNRTEAVAENTGGPPVTRRQARHVKAASEEFMELCAAALSEGGLHYVAEYHRGVFNYSLDLLDAPALSPLVPEGAGDRVRELYARAGRQLNFLLDRLDRSLRPVESGQLIRTVLGLKEGTLYHYYIRPGEYLTGVSLGPQAAEPGDRAMAQLVGRFRDRLHQMPLDHGGFTAAGREAEAPRVRVPAQTTTPAEDVLHVFDNAARGNGGDPIHDWCRDAVHTDDLHYVAYVDPALRFVSADLLADQSLLPFFKNITHQERRERYEQIGRRLNFIVGRLNHSLKAVLSGRLTRAVLDVEEGAIYYYAVGKAPFVIGVTLDQDRVSHADTRVGNLARKIQGHIRGPAQGSTTV